MRKYNTNSQTPASKAARARTASAYNKKLIADGKAKQLTMLLKISTYEEFYKLKDQLGISRPDCLQMLLDCYKKAHHIDEET